MPIALAASQIRPRRAGWLLIAAPVVVLTVVFSLGRRAAGGTDSPPIVGKFAIGKEGRMILLPVTIGNRQILCVLDTGASLCGFDSSLKSLLGAPIGTRVLKTPAGPSRVDTFDWPDARLGNSALSSSQPVICFDLAEVRRATNEPILGIIGIDVLRHCRVQIDFDRGILRFLESLPRDSRTLGEKVPLGFLAEGPAYLVGSIGDGRAARFFIDTGTQGNSLEAPLFDELLEAGDLRLGSQFASVTVAGGLRGDQGRLSSLSIGQSTHQDLKMSRTSLNTLGLRYFSRYRVTFDFPERCAYLHEGVHFTRPEPGATSGMALLWSDGEPIVEAVWAGGPAAAAGLKIHDKLVRINGKPAAGYDTFSLRQLLTSNAGTRISLTVRRGNDKFDTEIVLEED